MSVSGAVKYMLSCCFHCGRKPGYEEIPGSESPRNRRSLFKWGVISSAVIVVVLGLFFYHRQTTLFRPHETVPTLLSLVDPKTGNLLHAQWNPVYDRLHRQNIQWSSAPTIHEDFVITESTVTGSADTSVWNLLGLASHQAKLRRKRWTAAGRTHQDLFVLQCAQKETELTSTTVDTFHIKEAATYDQLDATTRGTWIVPIPRLRYTGCRWLLLHDSRVTAASPFLPLPHTTEPSNIHLAYTKDPSLLLVHFTSTVDGTPVVRLNGGDTLINQGAVTTTYEAADLCQAPANTTAPGQFTSPGYLHTIPLPHLPSHTTMTYQVGLETGQGVTWRQMEGSFTTNLEAGDDTVPLVYIVYGDQGCPHAGWEVGKKWMTAMVEREAKNNNVQSIHHFGDLSYANGAAHQWDAWLDMIEPATAKWPLMVSIGNHEYDYTTDDGADVSKDPSGALAPYHPGWGNFGRDSGGECGVPTAKRFQMPDTGNGVFWYSYDSGLVHTIVLSAEHDLSYGSRQQDWLLKDLTAVNRTLTPWLIVEVHRPLYEGEAFWQQNDVGVAMRMEVEDILVDYRVDLVFAGHYHAYHRTCDGLYRDKCDHHDGGPMHITVGTAGATLDPANVKLIDEPWTEKLILQTYGYGRVTIHNATTLQFQFVEHGSDKNGGHVHDNVWVERKR